jgi:predicted alpha/beta superfamily hydrolase
MNLSRGIEAGCGLLLLVSSSLVHSAPQESGAIGSVTIAQRYSIQSKALNETRTYLVHKPGGYDFTDERYPVIVLLDGEANIQHVSATADFLANNGRAMKMLVVGIENTDRQRDLTPPITNTRTSDRPEGKVGGAEKFLSFIAEELLPSIDRTYRTRPTRILIGHSFGGLFASYALLKRPALFKAYISVSPSLWWDNQALADEALNFAANHKEVQAAVYVTMGSEGGSTLGGTQKFVGALTSAGNGVEAVFTRWPEESHGSVVMRSVYEGLKWLHEIYYTTNPIQTYEVSGLQSYDKRFELISKHLGYQVKPPESELWQIQQYLRYEKRFEEAARVLERMVQLFPHATNARYDLGRVYLELQDKERAAATLTQLLKENPGHSGARAELQKTGVDPNTIVEDANPPARVLRAYVGEYRYSDEQLHVILEEGKLFTRVRDEKKELRALSATEFYAVDLDREYTFNRTNGRTVSVTVRMPTFTFESVRQK